MPVYEFYCPDCHIVFNFLSRRVTTEKRPDCPRCGRPHLERQVSLFAYSRGRGEEPAADRPDFDEARMEKAMEALGGEMEGMGEEDPRQMARLMRRLSEAAGAGLGAGFEEAIRRLEAGEEPAKVEEEMGDVFGGEELFRPEKLKGLQRKCTPPARDDTLYLL